MHLVEQPVERFRWRVPFTRAEITVQAWTTTPWCGWCASEAEQRYVDQVAAEAEAEGYEKGFRAGERTAKGEWAW